MRKRGAKTRGGTKRRTVRTRSAPRKTRWSTIAERVTLTHVPGDLQAACAAFESLDAAEQMRLARELVEVRRAEITRAYADVVSVSAGFRLTGEDDEENLRVEPEVCVVLVVKKKWRRDARGGDERRVPRHFFSYATIGNTRVLCAVPTDVEDSRRLAALRPQAQIRARRSDMTPQAWLGAIACAITRDGDRIPHAIGARHVFALSRSIGPNHPDGALITAVSDGAEIATATPTAGPLQNVPAVSFDGQLAEVSNERRLLESLDGILVQDFVLSWADFQKPPVNYWIRVPGGGPPVRAEFRAAHEEPVFYTDKLNKVLHVELARFHLPEATTHAGDSGSAVLTEPDGGKLVGMHIIGNPAARISLVIPAWRLLDPESYEVPNESWELWKGPQD